MDREPDLGVWSLTFAKPALAAPKMCLIFSSSIFDPPSTGVHMVWLQGQFSSNTAGAAADWFPEPDLGVWSLTFAKLALAAPKICLYVSSSIFDPLSRVHVVWLRGQFSSNTAGAAAD
jgi:hypothetical protein